MPRRSFDILFSLALFVLYTTIAVSLSAVGARIYLNTSSTLAGDYDQRTGVLYVAQKLRQGDAAGQVRLGELGDGDALVLGQSIGGVPCETWLYVHDGSLCELLLVGGATPEPGAGQAIMPMRSMRVDASRLQEGLLHIDFETADGEASAIDLHLRSGGVSLVKDIPKPPPPPKMTCEMDKKGTVLILSHRQNGTKGTVRFVPFSA